jgi:NDP-sugar pyrophosphorylase family protein|tara:strand:- start:111 stop:716 length:606 start_codon:yes stop_codon:yes gene_type:complete
MGEGPPKPLVVAQGKTILDRQINYFNDKVENIIVSLGHRGDEVVEHLKKEHADKNVTWVVEDEPLGTAGGLRLALGKTDADKIVVLNCDDIADVDLKKLEKQDDPTICVAHPRLPFGLVEEHAGHAKFTEKPLLDLYSSMGWYTFKTKDILSLLPTSGMLEYDVFPNMKLRVHHHEGFWRSLNLKKDVTAFEDEELPLALR